MSKIVIVGEDATSNVYKVVVLDDTLSQVVFTNILNEVSVVSSVMQGAVPVNFSVKNNRIVQDNGVFKRFNHGGISLVVLKTLVSYTGRVIGYRCLNARTLKIGATKRDQILSMQAQQNGFPILQNAVIRNNTINAYDGKQFEKEVIGERPSKKAPSTPHAPQKPQGRAHLPSYIQNPKLSKEQCMLLTKAKKSGAYVEGFNNPNLSIEAMDYYKDVIVSKEIADECRPIICNAKLSVPQIDELYQCVISGVQYSDLNNDKLSPVEMQTEREVRVAEMWGDLTYEEVPDQDLWNKCVKVSETLR